MATLGALAADVASMRAAGEIYVTEATTRHVEASRKALAAAAAEGAPAVERLVAEWETQRAAELATTETHHLARHLLATIESEEDDG